MKPTTDYEAELAAIEREIADLEPSATAADADSDKVTRLIYRRYQRASLSGDLRELTAVEAAINAALPRLRRPADLYFVKASIALKLHRLADVENILAMNSDLRDSAPGRTLQADVDFQRGRYEEAKQKLESLIRDDPTWDGLARMAHLKNKLGDADGAEQLYAEAEDELTAKEMRHYAWVELQRGLLDLTRGRYEQARARYERAERAYSGYWMVAEHRAELLAAQGRFDEAVSLYEQVIARLPRPEFQQALGELFLFMGEPEQAEPHLEAALAAYLESAGRGEVHYYHHLADFYADVRKDGREAVRWAREDLALRENVWTLAALGWALYRDGRLGEAVEAVAAALAAGVGDAHLLFKAAEIYKAAGKTGEGEMYGRKAAELNPHPRNFHVHR
ncbi:MAG TPA: tetratricopeptide repeat protein [Blastocatellia bacterium]|nr:tetratricopeptide repeat protein [Blastocatellia bacterium]